MKNIIRVVSITFLAVQMLAGIARAQCALYPIALSAQTLQNVAPGTFIQNIYNGAQPGNFGWLTWAGSPTLKLQQSSSLQPAVWTDVPGTLGVSSASVPTTGPSSFFRLAQ